MVDENRAHLSGHQTILNQTLQKQLASLEFNAGYLHADMNTGVADYGRALSSAYDRIAGYDRALSWALSSAYDRIAGYDRALSSAYDRIAGVADYARKFSPHESIARIANPAVDWQKQLNLFKATQARLEFPNIIRNGLSANPFRISTPTQPRTPLFDLPPTSSTGEVYEEISPEIIPAPSAELVPITNHKPVFIVHGHDHETRDDVSKFVSNWGLTPTILDEQPNKGRTIIEKFEDLANDVGFAIVLLTPDDVGSSVKDTANLKPRARQNVIFELGYFLKAVGRPKVCILYKEGVELPSDIHGILYVHMDDAGEWRQKVIKEMEAVGLLIDANEI